MSAFWLGWRLEKRAAEQGYSAMADVPQRHISTRIEHPSRVPLMGPNKLFSVGATPLLGRKVVGNLAQSIERISLP